MRVSVVIATYNRSQLLPRLFNALNHQTLPDDELEVVIVDDGSTDDTPRILAELARSSRVPVRVLRQSPNAGPAKARNRGANEAKGGIIAFTDDDCVPTADWLRAGLELAGRGKIVVGRTVPLPNQIAGPFSRTMQVRDARFMPTCNVFYAREDFLASGGFDPRFRRAAGEDTDLGLRLVEKGAQALFCRDACVHHEVRPSSFRASLREAWGKWIDLPLVVRLHPTVRRHLPGKYFWKTSHIYAWGGLVGLLGLAFSPWAALALLPWAVFRSQISPLARGRAASLLSMPGAMVLDAAEAVAMARGSIRHRTLLL
jgi:glycosyltransferase involved in cell wall biosynthesis